MKRIFLLSLVFLWPTALAFGQVVNPTVIYQDTDIALHLTDVYYHPFAPPAPTDTSWNLSCIASELRDPDGVLSYTYAPRTHGIELSNWQPAGDTAPLGNTVVWTRLFTAMDKPSGAHSDIIAGGDMGDSVIISK